MRKLIEKMKEEKEALYERSKEAITKILNEDGGEEEVHSVATRISTSMNKVLDFYLSHTERSTFINSKFDQLDDGRYKVTIYHSKSKGCSQ